MKLVLHGVLVCWLLMSVSLFHVQDQTAIKRGCGFPDSGECYFIRAMVREATIIDIVLPNGIELLNATTLGVGSLQSRGPCLSAALRSPATNTHWVGQSVASI